MSSLVLTSSITTGRAQALEARREQLAAAKYVPALWVEFLCHSYRELFGSRDCRAAQGSRVSVVKGRLGGTPGVFCHLEKCTRRAVACSEQAVRGRAERNRRREQGPRRQVSPSDTCGFSTGVTVSQGSGEEVSARPALLLHSLQCAHVSGKAAVKREFVTRGDFYSFTLQFLVVQRLAGAQHSCCSCCAGAGLWELRDALGQCAAICLELLPSHRSCCEPLLPGQAAAGTPL